MSMLINELSSNHVLRKVVTLEGVLCLLKTFPGVGDPVSSNHRKYSSGHVFSF